MAVKKLSQRDAVLRGKRIAEARRAVGMGQEQFAKHLYEDGSLSRGAVGNWELGGGITLENLQRIADRTGASFDWLVSGAGEPPAVQKKAKSLVSSYDPDAPPELEAGGEEEPSETPRPVDFPKDAIKELAVKAGMGTGQTITTTYKRDGKEIKEVDAILDDYWRLPPHFVRSNLGAKISDLLVIECTGDSMEPTLRAGDRVIANTAHRKPSPDGLYAIRDSLGEIVVKRLEIFGKDPIRVRVISDNPRHGPKEWDLDEMEIVGKVVAGLKLF